MLFNFNSYILAQIDYGFIFFPIQIAKEGDSLMPIVLYQSTHNLYHKKVLKTDPNPNSFHLIHWLKPSSVETQNND